MNKLIYILLATIIVSCGKNEVEEPLDMGYDYYPIEQSSYRIYNVDSIVWDDFNNTVDTFSFIVKLKIDAEFTDNAGRTSNWLKKYSKTDTSDFKFVSNSTITKTNERLETVVENIREIKLIFPLLAGSTWNMNSLNTNRELNSICTDFDYSTSILGKYYEHCADIEYENEVNLIQEFVHEEIYARNYGMIYKKQIHKEQKTTGLRGYSVIYKLKEYGKE